VAEQEKTKKAELDRVRHCCVLDDGCLVCDVVGGWASAAVPDDRLREPRLRGGCGRLPVLAECERRVHTAAMRNVAGIYGQVIWT
jgi:hypothetical protein